MRLIPLEVNIVRLISAHSSSMEKLAQDIAELAKDVRFIKRSIQLLASENPPAKRAQCHHAEYCYRHPSLGFCLRCEKSLCKDCSVECVECGFKQHKECIAWRVWQPDQGQFVRFSSVCEGCVATCQICKKTVIKRELSRKENPIVCMSAVCQTYYHRSWKITFFAVSFNCNAAILNALDRSLRWYRWKQRFHLECVDEPTVLFANGPADNPLLNVPPDPPQRRNRENLARPRIRARDPESISDEGVFEL